MAILLPPAAANTGGALPTPPTSTEPAPIACNIGGPEVKSDQATLNGSLWIRPAAVSSASAPDPAWSPTCRVTLDRLVVPACTAERLPAAAGAALVLPEPEEHAAANPAIRMLAASGRNLPRLTLISFLPS